MLKKLHPKDRRTSIRLPTGILAVAKSSQGQRHKLAISDLSVRGCAITTSGHPLKPGLAYGVKTPGPETLGLETLGAVAAWTEGASGGLAFEQPLHPAAADHFVARYPRSSCED